MTKITAATVTAAQVEAGLTDDWCYSDAFKEIYGYRPRGEYVNSPGYVAEFWNSFEELFDAAQEQDRADLAAACEAHGIEATTWSSYYDQRDEQVHLEYQEYIAAEEAAAAERAEFYRRGSPAPAIEAWAYGA
jgi:LmbE family N-acetylglucosaminyl deacetylase